MHVGFDYRSLARSVGKRVASLRHVLVVGDAEEFVPLAEVDAPPEIMAGPDARDVALLLLSGGTTGAPQADPPYPRRLCLQRPPQRRCDRPGREHLGTW